jgi:hypothetical protein
VPQSRLLIAGFPLWRPVFEPTSGHIGFVVEKRLRGQVFCEYSGLSCQFPSHRLLHNHRHLSSGFGTVTGVTPHPKTLKTVGLFVSDELFIAHRQQCHVIVSTIHLTLSFLQIAPSAGFSHTSTVCIFYLFYLQRRSSKQEWKMS